MRIDRAVQKKENIELLDLWMQAPPWDKPVVPFLPEPYLQDLHLALKWLTEHGGSSKKVWPMLYAHHQAKGDEYSMATARRRVDEAMQFFVKITPHQTRWTTGFLLDDVLEQAQSAKRAGKHEAYAKLIREARELIKMMDAYIREDAERITEPIAIQAVFAPEEAGITYDPNIRQKAAEWLRLREERMNKLYQVQDAVIENEPDASGSNDAH